MKYISCVLKLDWKALCPKLAQEALRKGTADAAKAPLDHGLTDAERAELESECDGTMKESRTKLTLAATAGCLVACSSSGIVVGFEEMVDTESYRQRFAFV
eukprot:gnl/MRDRNA2_/MRDRNA2_62779_c0_seq1.p1 gnl/MRDRNA2_/MRDRNA2_62779_c0~~gnl/MRDRNA2_/MRDRNA2_62779_c0_seq1.p1  ORF type:complete len:101 (-),score=19.61 gnl/MRDRNA2_/MRDRNA2_62779_c0_seq1:20-322(-)